MSVSDENALLKMIIETQASRIQEQDATIKELRQMVDELRSLKANLEETLEELRRQFFGVRSEKTPREEKSSSEAKKTVTVREHTRERKPSNAFIGEAPSLDQPERLRELRESGP